MRLARSGIDTPLKVSSIFGVISGILLPSSMVILTLKLSDYGNPLNLAFIIIAGMTYGLLVICGSLVVLFASMSIERRGVLAFFVFLASVFAIIGSFFFISFIILGLPQT